MLKKRIGNDISFTWRIYRKESDYVVPETFEGKDVIVELISPRQRPAEIENISISAGVVGFVFKGKKQRVPGSYTAVLLENKGEDGMVTLDVVNAVTLVPHSYMEEDGDDGDVIEAESVELTSTISAGGGGSQVQADWDETNTTSPAFIKNKPNINGLLDGKYDKENGVRFRDKTIIVEDSEKNEATEIYPTLIDFYDTFQGVGRNGCIWFNGGYMRLIDEYRKSNVGCIIVTEVELAGKQDTINDLATIRSGAAAGATAVQPADLTLIDDRLDDVEYCLGDYLKETYVFNANNKPEVSTEPVYTDKTLYTAVNKGSSVMSLNCKLSSSSQEVSAVWIGRLYSNGKILFTKSGTATLYLVLYAGISLYYPNNILLSICDSNDNVVRNIRTTELTYNSSKICTAFSCEVADGYYIKMVYNDPNSYVWLGQIDFEITEVKQISTDVHANSNAIAAIEQKIPAQASSNNQLADKDFVNSSIATNTATYRGSYNLVSDLSLTISATHAQIATALATAIQTVDNNDYCYVQIPVADATPTEIASVERYKFNGTAWEYEYALNNSGYTAAQWAALNSGITSGLVTKLSALPTNSELATLLGGKANTDDLAPIATSGNYNDLTGKPAVDDTPTPDSNNLVKSGGVYGTTPSITDTDAESDLDVSDEDGNVLMRLSGGHIKTKKFNSAEPVDLMFLADVSACKYSGNLMHISFDDTNACLTALFSQRPNSIYDITFFDNLRTLHNTYDACFSCYVYVESLANVTNTYANEFQAAKSWLRWNFHTYNDHVYDEDTSIISDYDLGITRLLTMVGNDKDCLDHGLRGNMWELSLANAQYVRDNVTHSSYIFFAKDAFSPSSGNYYLREEQKTFVFNNGFLIDVKNKVLFIQTCARLDDDEKTAASKEYIAENIKWQKSCEVLNHERAFDYTRMDLFLDWAKNTMNFRFGFFDNIYKF